MGVPTSTKAERKPAWEPALNTESIEAIARICHESNRAWCEHWDDRSQVPWNEAPEWQRESCIAGVIQVMADWRTGQKISPERSHANWVEHKLKNGWKWAKNKNAERKEHNCLLPWAELSPKERLKDVLFTNIVLSFLEEKVST